MSSSSGKNDDNALLDQILRPQASHYDILGLPTAAPMPDVKREYKKLALRFHPDKYRGNEKERALEAFQIVNNVYEVLGEESSKARYDATLRTSTSSNSRRSSTASATAGDSSTSTSTGYATEESLPSWFNFATIFSGLSRSMAQAPEHFDSHKNTDRYRSMATFLRATKGDIDNTSDEFVNQAGGLILTALADVFVDVLPFILQAYKVKNPTFVYAVSAIAAFGMVMAKDEIVKMFEWHSIDRELKVIVIDSLIDYYRNKTAFRW